MTDIARPQPGCRRAVQVVAVLAGLLLAMAPIDAQVTTRSGFLKPGAAWGTVAGRPSSASYEGLCRYVTALRLLPLCPPEMTTVVPPQHFGPPLEIGGNLPHLRFEMVLTRLEHQVVLGNGFPGFAFWWNISSAAATDQYPDPASGDWGVYAPTPGGLVNYDPPVFMYSGVIANGCSPATVFDVHLDGLLGGIETMNGTVIHLSDSVTGTGFYNFHFPIDYAFPTGMHTDHSRINVSGKVRVYCTAQL